LKQNSKFEDLRVRNKGFTTIELLVAIAVTAVLVGLLLSISTNVLTTQRQSSNSLETNQIAQFVLDRIQEDLQCAIYRNDGNAWMAISILEDKGNSGSWTDEPKPDLTKPSDQMHSLRLIESDWSEDTNIAFDPHSSQASKNTGAARAIAYQLIRHGITNSTKSIPRYQLYRTDVSALDTYVAGYDFGSSGGYSENASNNSQDEESDPIRVPSAIINPIINLGSSLADASVFSLATNIIDFGVRAYRTEKKKDGTGNFIQLFPVISSKMLQSYDFYSIRFPNPNNSSEGPFPDCIDVMLKILTAEGAKIISNYELGLIPLPSGKSHEEHWWELADQNSEVFIRRIKIYGNGI
jgi:prepilin-type N-terminal cleavage/methylation domain-containing protein